MSLLKLLKARAAGQVLAQQSVGILVGAPLPGVVRGRKVDFGAKPGFQLLVSMDAWNNPVRFSRLADGSLQITSSGRDGIFGSPENDGISLK
jgi:hypothetical protein